MGKRAFDYMLTNPTFDKEYLQGQYDQTAAFMASHCVEEIRISLRNVKDLEKIMRSIVLKKAYQSHRFVKNHQFDHMFAYKTHLRLKISQKALTVLIARPYLF